MEVLVEKVRQELKIGGAGFEPTSLERYRSALGSCEATAGWLGKYKDLLHTFTQDATGFLTATTRILTDCPMPHEFTQNPESRRVEQVPHAAPPEGHHRLFQPGLHHTLAEQLPGGFSSALDREVALPVNMWLTAYRVAKDKLSHLERQRLVVDAQRRRVERRAARARKHFSKEADARADLDHAMEDANDTSSDDSDYDETSGRHLPSEEGLAGAASPRASAGHVHGATGASGGAGAGLVSPSGVKQQKKAERAMEKHRERGVKELQAACEKATQKLAPLISDFEMQEERVMTLIKWLVDAAPRLRAHLAHALLALHGGLGAAPIPGISDAGPMGLPAGEGGRSALAPPDGLLPEFPMDLLEATPSGEEAMGARLPNKPTSATSDIHTADAGVVRGTTGAGVAPAAAAAPAAPALAPGGGVGTLSVLGSVADAPAARRDEVPVMSGLAPAGPAAGAEAAPMGKLHATQGPFIKVADRLGAAPEPAGYTPLDERPLLREDEQPGFEPGARGPVDGEEAAAAARAEVA